MPPRAPTPSLPPKPKDSPLKAQSPCSSRSSELDTPYRYIASPILLHMHTPLLTPQSNFHEEILRNNQRVRPTGPLRLPTRQADLEIILPQQLRDQLLDFKHGNVLSEADTRAGSPLVQSVLCTLTQEMGFRNGLHPGRNHSSWRVLVLRLRASVLGGRHGHRAPIRRC
jgi:hypothetical protein